MKRTSREKKFKEGRRTIMIDQYLADSIQIRQVNLLILNRAKLILGGYVVSCAVPVGNVSWMLFQEGRSSNFS